MKIITAALVLCLFGVCLWCLGAFQFLGRVGDSLPGIQFDGDANWMLTIGGPSDPVCIAVGEGGADIESRKWKLGAQGERASMQCGDSASGFSFCVDGAMAAIHLGAARIEVDTNGIGTLASDADGAGFAVTSLRVLLQKMLVLGASGPHLGTVGLLSDSYPRFVLLRDKMAGELDFGFFLGSWIVRASADGAAASGVHKAAALALGFTRQAGSMFIEALNGVTTRRDVEKK